MDHYFTSEPASEHHRGVVRYALPHRVLEFATDAGVFSREAVDEGSAALLALLPPLEGRILDLGCGYGVLGLTLMAMHPGLTAVLADVNRRALGLARENAAALGLDAQVVESDGFSGVEGPFDAIVTNPPIRAGKAVYYPWFAQAPAYLRQGGAFYCVVQKKQGAPSVVKALQAAFGSCQILGKPGGYWILEASKEDTAHE